MNVLGIVQKFKSLWKKNNDATRNMTKKEKWILLFLISALMAVLFMPIEDKKVIDSNSQEISEEQGVSRFSSTNKISAYEAHLSETLVHMLEQIDGAGKVDAWVTIEESEEYVFSHEGTSDITELKEEDSAGGTRIEEKESSNKTVIADSNGNPYVIKTIQPKVEGVFVVAEGAGNSIVKKNISDAVEVLFGIDAHRIKVAKKKLEE